MCIRDSAPSFRAETTSSGDDAPSFHAEKTSSGDDAPSFHCLLYTSDAADERSSVDLGGRRIIKKKKNVHQQHRQQLW